MFHLPFWAASRQSLEQEWQKKLSLPTKDQPLLKVFTPNPEQVIQAKQDSQFAAILRQADYLLPDGIGVVWASQILHFFGHLSSAITERISGVEMVQFLLNLARVKQWPILIVGGQEYQKYCPNAQQLLTIKGVQHLYELEPQVFWSAAYRRITAITGQEENELEQIIQQVQPVLVFVALGAPAQEQWVIQHQQLLQTTQVRMVMVTGGAFDFIWGKVRRAPQHWQKVGLEWLYRLIQEPWRARRQFRLIQFIFLVIAESIFGQQTEKSVADPPKNKKAS